jgi:arylsulfatase
MARIDAVGGPDGPAHYPEGWAMAGNTPFRRYKQSVDLGGVRSPLVVCWPEGIRDTGAIRPQFAHVIDIAATVVDVAGLRSRVGMDGASLRNTFASPLAPAPRPTQYWEMFGHRAIWQDGWKAVTEHVPGADYADDVWRLYDTRADFAENRDLAADEPERLADLVAAWWREAERNEVLPLDDRSLVTLLNDTRTPHQLANRRRLVLYPENTHVPVSTGVTSAGRSMRIIAELTGRAPGAGGVLVASGARQGGYVLYVAGDELVFEHLALGQRTRLSGPIDPGDARLELEIGHDGRRARVELRASGRTVSGSAATGFIAHPSFWGLDVGRAPAAPITEGYAAAAALPPGVLQSVTIEFLEPMTSAEMADLLAQAE